MLMNLPLLACQSCGFGVEGCTWLIFQLLLALQAQWFFSNKQFGDSVVKKIICEIKDWRLLSISHPISRNTKIKRNDTAYHSHMLSDNLLRLKSTNHQRQCLRVFPYQKQLLIKSKYSIQIGQYHELCVSMSLAKSFLFLWLFLFQLKLLSFSKGPVLIHSRFSLPYSKIK